MTRRRCSIAARRGLYSVLGAFSLLLTLSIAPVSYPPGSNQPNAKESILPRALPPVGLLAPAIAQRLSPTDVARQIYARLPYLPLENDYVDNEMGDIDPDNTLLSRFIRYHLFVARRSPDYRLDWKITLADYLGLNDWIREEEYPGSSDLTPNPKDGDIEAIQSLNRAERDALVNELVALFETQGDRIPSYGFGY